MPRKPKKPCSYPGCPNLTETKYCEAHKALEPTLYTVGSKNPFYRSYEWKKKRSEFLLNHPFCVLCGREAKIVDHIVPITLGGATLDDENLQSMCWSCHSKKSIKEGSSFKRKVYTY